MTVTSTPVDNFESRLQRARLLVIGAQYSQSEFNFFSKIDANYVGFGFAYQDNVIEIVPNNPLQVNWEDLTPTVTNWLVAFMKERNKN
jgi:hypothetical protein